MITLTRKHKQRLAIVLLIVLGIGITTALALTAFRENMQFFFSPSQVAAGEAPKDKVIRVGGLVTKGSLQRASDSLTVKFVVTDMAHNVTIQYTGILPDLFREGQGIIATGKLQADGGFIANEVLAKHDENYMPPEVNQALKDAKVKK
ncbi:MAG: cytochrome c maturation protein CcmE [Thiotrichaceae bacterium]|nr:cytochrome c maturation protein CcmE [Thiotrichaceae bacterium]